MIKCSSKTYPYFFKNLANPLKIRIVISLKEKAKNVGEISRELEVEQSKLSHALTSLKVCNIINSRKVGRQNIYSLNKKTIIPLLKLLDKHAQEHCKEFCNHTKN